MDTLELLVAHINKADDDLEVSQTAPRLSQRWRDIAWERYCGRIVGLCLAIDAAGGEYYN